jgi:hypothetical protein
MGERPTADANAVMLEFLKIDLDMAMTFIEIAVSPTSAERTARCRGEARRAYDTVPRMMNRIDLSQAEAGEIQKRLAKSEVRTATAWGVVLTATENAAHRGAVDF